MQHDDHVRLYRLIKLVEAVAVMLERYGDHFFDG